MDLVVERLLVVAGRSPIIPHRSECRYLRINGILVFQRSIPKRQETNGIVAAGSIPIWRFDMGNPSNRRRALMGRSPVRFMCRTFDGHNLQKTRASTTCLLMGSQ